MAHTYQRGRVQVLVVGAKLLLESATQARVMDRREFVCDQHQMPRDLSLQFEGI
jgi:hypothetical protein